MTVLTKGEFAARRGVARCTLSNWIARGRLSGEALAPHGGINVEAAEAQLGVTVDPVRQASHPSAVVDFGAAGDLLRARALSASVDAERKRRELEHERGRYTLTEEARSEWAKMLGDFLQTVERSLTDLAETLQLGNDEATQLRRWWRRQRADAARVNREKAATTARFVEDPEAPRGAEIS